MAFEKLRKPSSVRSSARSSANPSHQARSVFHLATTPVRKEHDGQELAARDFADPSSKHASKHFDLSKLGDRPLEAFARPPELEGSGEPLPSPVSDRLRAEGAPESRISAIRVHSNRAAAQLSHALSARAATFGSHIALGAWSHSRPRLTHEAFHALDPRPMYSLDRDQAKSQSKEGHVDAELLDSLSLEDLLWLRGELQNTEGENEKLVIRSQLVPELDQRLADPEDDGEARYAMNDVTAETDQISIDFDVIAMLAKTSELKRLKSARERHEKLRQEIAELEAELELLGDARGRDLIAALEEFDSTLPELEASVAKSESQVSSLTGELAKLDVAAKTKSASIEAPAATPLPDVTDTPGASMGDATAAGPGASASVSREQLEAKLAQAQESHGEHQAALDSALAERRDVISLMERFFPSVYKDYKHFDRKRDAQASGKKSRKNKKPPPDYAAKIAELDVTGGAAGAAYLHAEARSEAADHAADEAQTELQAWQDEKPNERYLLREGQTPGDVDPLYAEWEARGPGLEDERARRQAEVAAAATARSEADKTFKTESKATRSSFKAIEKAYRQTEVKLERARARLAKIYPTLESAAEDVDARYDAQLRKRMQKDLGSVSSLDAEIEALVGTTIPAARQKVDSLDAEIDSEEFEGKKRKQKRKIRKRRDTAAEELEGYESQLAAKRAQREEYIQEMMEYARIHEEHGRGSKVIRDVSKAGVDAFAWTPRTKASAAQIIDEPHVTLHGSVLEHDKKGRTFVRYGGRKYKILAKSKFFGLAADGTRGAKDAMGRVKQLLLPLLEQRLPELGFEATQVDALIGIIKAATPLLKTEGSIDSLNTYDSQLLTLAGRGEKSRRVSSMLHAGKLISGHLGLGAEAQIDRMLAQVPKIAVPAANSVAGGRFNLPAIHELLEPLEYDHVFDAVLLAALNDGVFTYLGEKISKRKSNPPVFTRRSDFPRLDPAAAKAGASKQAGDKLDDTFAALGAGLHPAVMAITIHNRIGAPADMPDPTVWTERAFERYEREKPLARSLSKQVAYLLKVRSQYNIVRTNERVTYESFAKKWRQKIKDFDNYFKWQKDPGDKKTSLQFDNDAAREVIPGWGPAPDAPRLQPNRPDESHVQVTDRGHQYIDLGEWVIPQKLFEAGGPGQVYEIGGRKPVQLLARLPHEPAPSNSSVSDALLTKGTEVLILESSHLLVSEEISFEQSSDDPEFERARDMRGRVRVRVESGDAIGMEGWIPVSAVFRREKKSKKKKKGKK